MLKNVKNSSFSKRQVLISSTCYTHLALKSITTVRPIFKPLFEDLVFIMYYNISIIRDIVNYHHVF